MLYKEEYVAFFIKATILLLIPEFKKKTLSLKFWFAKVVAIIVKNHFSTRNKLYRRQRD